MRFYFLCVLYSSVVSLSAFAGDLTKKITMTQEAKLHEIEKKREKCLANEENSEAEKDFCLSTEVVEWEEHLKKVYLQCLKDCDPQAQKHLQDMQNAWLKMCNIELKFEEWYWGELQRLGFAGNHDPYRATTDFSSSNLKKRIEALKLLSSLKKGKESTTSPSPATTKELGVVVEVIQKQCPQFQKYFLLSQAAWQEFREAEINYIKTVNPEPNTYSLETNARDRIELFRKRQEAYCELLKYNLESAYDEYREINWVELDKTLDNVKKQ